MVDPMVDYLSNFRVEGRLTATDSVLNLGSSYVERSTPGGPRVY